MVLVDWHKYFLLKGYHKIILSRGMGMQPTLTLF